jgi:hypothetical protein
MVQAIALSRTVFETACAHPADIARGAIVLGCGLALALAGQPLPIIG